MDPGVRALEKPEHPGSILSWPDPGIPGYYKLSIFQYIRLAPRAVHVTQLFKNFGSHVSNSGSEISRPFCARRDQIA